MSNTEAPAPPQAPHRLSRVSSETVEKATQALVKWRDVKSSTQKAQLLEQDDVVYLVLALKKIPQKGRTNPYKIELPHPLTDPVNDSSELCLIIDDRPQSNLTKEIAAKKIEADSIPIKKLLKLTKLRTDYRPFEAKRKLCNSYDMFFADNRIIPLLPRLLGKQFFQRKKIPIPLNLKHKNWKEQVEKACSSGLLYLRTGTCCVVKVGKLSMGIKEITENAINAINGISEIVPGQWGNIRSFHLKLADSLPLPLYQTVPSLKLKIESKKDAELAIEIAQKKPSKDKSNGKNKDEGSSNKKKKKGRIHEVQYMDSNVSEMLDDDDEMDEDSEKDVDAGEDSVDVEMESADSGSKKRKKGAELKTGKPTKKVAKEVKKDDAAKQTEDNGNAELESGSKKRKKGAELKSGKPTKTVVKELKKEDEAKQSEDSVNDELESGNKKRKKTAILKSGKPTKTVVKEVKQNVITEDLKSSQPLKKTTKAKKDETVKEKKNTDQIKAVEETIVEKKTKAKKVAAVPQKENSEVEKRKALKKTKEDSKDIVKQTKQKKGGEQSVSAEKKRSPPKKAKSIGVKVIGKKKKPVA